MVDLSRCVLQCGNDVFRLKIRHFGKEFFRAETLSQQIQYIRDPDAHAANAGASAALREIHGNPLEQVGHDVYSSGPGIPADNEFILAQHHADVDSVFGDSHFAPHDRLYDRYRRPVATLAVLGAWGSDQGKWLNRL